MKAEITVAEYQKIVQSHEAGDLNSLKIYVVGLGEGIRATNAWLTASGTSLFCAPEKLALGDENFLDILDREIKDSSKRLSKSVMSEKYISVVLLRGLIETFPCESPKH